MGFCQLCGLPSSPTGCGSSRAPLAGSRRSSSNLPFEGIKKEASKDASFFMAEKERFAASGQLKPTIHTSHAKAHSYSLGEAHYIASQYVFNMDFCSNSSLKCSPMQQALVPLLSSLETKNPILKIFQTKTI